MKLCNCVLHLQEQTIFLWKLPAYQDSIFWIWAKLCQVSLRYVHAKFGLVSSFFLFVKLQSWKRIIQFHLLKKHFCSQSSTIKNTDDFHYKNTIKLALFTVSKKEWNTKEDTSKSMKKKILMPKWLKGYWAVTVAL